MALPTEEEEDWIREGRKEGRKEGRIKRWDICFVRRRDGERYEEPMYVREAVEGRGILTTVTVEQEVRIVDRISVCYDSYCNQ